MKILLVYPEYPETFWSFKYALKFISKKASLPPLGLLTVAALLPKDWEKKLVDMTVTALIDRDIKWADYVFISAMSIQKESVKKIIAQCKRLGTKIVAGGPLFTSGYEDFEDDVDYFILNEAEITLPLFLEDLEGGHLKHIYTSDQWVDLKKTPIPLWELADINKYATMCIQYSRGCPFNCDFCDVTLLFGHKMRLKTKDRKYPFSFTTQASINLSDDEELIQLMVQAGFGSVFVGIETPNEKSLAECNKLQNKNRDLIACIKKIQRFGLIVNGGFIMGFDNDTPAIFERLIEFIQKSGIASAMVGLLNAPRGTKLYQRLAKENRLLKEATGDNTDLSINFIPKMNYKALIDNYKRVLNTIYSPKCYYERLLTLLKNMKTLKKKRYQFHLCYLTAFLKSIWQLGIIGKERIYYWKIFFWTLFRRPQLLPMAITYAVYGFHFRKIYENY